MRTGCRRPLPHDNERAPSRPIDCKRENVPADGQAHVHSGAAGVPLQLAENGAAQAAGCEALLMAQ
jgi:hypothetical protein